MKDEEHQQTRSRAAEPGPGVLTGFAIVAIMAAPTGAGLLAMAPGCTHADLKSVAAQAAPIIMEQAKKLGQQISAEKSVCFPVPEAELPDDFGGGVIVVCYAPELDEEELEAQLE